MQINLTAEQEAQLSQLAAETFDRGLASEAHFIEAVKVGQDAATRADFIETSEVWADIEQALRR